MAAQFVFFYAILLLMAVKYPGAAMGVIVVYSSLVLRSIWKSWRP